MKKVYKLRDNSSIDYKKFDMNMTDFVNENGIKSPTDYLIVTSTKSKFTYIYERVLNYWSLIYKWSCTVGKPETPTIQGVFSSGEKYPAIQEGEATAKYALNIVEEFYYHSVIYNSDETYVTDDRLGVAVSHGCIRLATGNARWIYDNVPTKTTIVIR
ncbi:MAG: L,D-transpeptidase [Romboutsia sp.]